MGYKSNFIEYKKPEGTGRIEVKSISSVDLNGDSIVITTTIGKVLTIKYSDSKEASVNLPKIIEKILIY